MTKSEKQHKAEVDAAFAAQASNQQIRDEMKKADMIGHNSDLNVSPEVQAMLENYRKLKVDVKAINSTISGIFNDLKERYGISKVVARKLFADLQKEHEVMVAEEQGRNDLKKILGIQMTLDLVDQNAEEAAETEALVDDPIAAGKAEKSKNLKAV